MLDCAINQGPVTSIKLLQEATCIQQDGIIGPVTLSAAEDTMPHVMTTFAALRAWRYEINRNEDVFGKGWFLRLFRLFDIATLWNRP